jgi:ribosomal protein S18 acetylase RimI-like enzyme
VTIRPARPEDAEPIHHLVAEAYGHYVARIGRRPGPMNDDYERRVAAGQAWVLEEAGDIVGLAVLEEGPDHLLLDNVAVLPAAQGRGHGRALIAFAEGEAARREFGELRLYTHELMAENIALYQRLGFVEIARVAEKGFRRVFMAKRVQAIQP